MSSSTSRLNLSKISFKKFGGKKIISEEFILLAKKTERTKIGITVSKKVAASAVDRNRIKRIIFEAVRKQKEFRGEIIISVKKNIAELKSNDIQYKLERLIKKL